MTVYGPWSCEQARSVITAHAGMDGAALPILHALQAEFGCVPPDAEPMVAEALNISRAEVHGLVTFYHDFRRTPPGRHVLRLCRAEACQSVGGTKLADHARRALQLDWHQTSTDGAITLEPVFCLGFCAAAPAAMLDGRPLVRLDSAALDRALDALQ